MHSEPGQQALPLSVMQAALLLLRARLPSVRAQRPLARAMASTSAPAELDRSAFSETHSVTALRVPKRKCADAMRLLKGCAFTRCALARP